jgi:outer membrane biosynthesis protein TonB
MANEKKELKVTDKRIFTAEGEIKEEFRNDIHPSDPSVATAPPPEPAPKEEPKPAPKPEPKAAPKAKPAEPKERRSTGDRAGSPETPFANFIEPLIAQAYMSLGMLRNPYQPQAKTDPAAARQMIEILNLLQEKTAGNLTPEEEDFLTTHLGELKLAYVQRTKSI